MEKIRALQLSFIAILSVVFIEGFIGVVVNSLAILSDAAHALFDSVTMLILFLTTRMALKPPDEEHLYGHAKIESIGGLFGGISLLALAALILREAALRLMGEVAHVHPEIVGFVAVFYTLGIDVFRMTIARKALLNKNENSVTIKASFFHALADFASTVIALLGFGLAVLTDYLQADAVASIILSGSLVYLSVKLLKSSYLDLSDAVPKDFAEKIRFEIENEKGISCCKELKVRRVGQKSYIETTVTVRDSMTLQEAHDLTAKIEHKIAKKFGDSTVTIHVEPEEKK
ncbi:MAG: cation diffusion facilitator family transporter [Candidatus Bathyarchaeia archaeon]